MLKLNFITRHLHQSPIHVALAEYLFAHWTLTALVATRFVTVLDYTLFAKDSVTLVTFFDGKARYIETNNALKNF